MIALVHDIRQWLVRIVVDLSHVRAHIAAADDYAKRDLNRFGDEPALDYQVEVRLVYLAVGLETVAALIGDHFVWRVNCGQEALFEADRIC